MSKIKSVLITGTSSGLGLELAKLFLKNNYLVTGVSRSQSVIDDHHYTHVICDLTKPEEINKLNGPLGFDHDIVINNAGITLRGYLTEHEDEDITDIININFTIPSLIAKRYFTYNYGNTKLLVNIASGSGVGVFRKLPIYGPAKTALVALGNYLTKDLQDAGIDNTYIMTFVPGPLDTKLCPEHYKTKDSGVPVVSPDEYAQLVFDEINKKENYVLHSHVILGGN